MSCPVKIEIQTQPVTVIDQGRGIQGPSGPKIVNAQTIYDFPTVGDDGVVYCCIGENAVYRWSPDLGHYVCVGRDYTEVQIINGGVINDV